MIRSNLVAVFATARSGLLNGVKPALRLASLKNVEVFFQTMYAIIQTGGKQYKVSEGTVLMVEKLEVEAGQQLTLDQVLMVGDDNGGFKIGDPLVAGAKVEAVVLEQGKHKKVVVYKYKKRKNYRKKQGHRQPFTKIKIEKIIA